jgi:hypothetical protein
MRLSEMIAAIGDDNVKIQNLDEASITLDWDAKKGTRISFGTEIPLRPDGTERLGLVIWLDREAVRKAIAAEKETLL